MSKKRKGKIHSLPKNFKISTRILITSVLAIVIPIIIIVVLLCALLVFNSNRYGSSNVQNGAYSVIYQLQWGQTISELTEELLNDNDDIHSLDAIKSAVAPLEESDCLIFISKNGEAFYSSDPGTDILNQAEEMSGKNADKNLYYFGDKGLAFITTAAKNNNEFKVVIVNASYAVTDIRIQMRSQNLFNILINRARIIILVVLFTFILAIIIISLITTKTIVGPIEQITRGANEFAKGNFDYEIKYKSKNELGQLADSFNEMRLKVKESIEEKNRANQRQKEVIAGIAHDLRTPLTSVKGYLEGLRDGIADTPEKYDRYMNIIYNSTRDTEKMLDDLLAISKFELGNISLNCENVTVLDFVGFASEYVEPLSKVDFEFKIIDKTRNSPVLRIDTDYFTRVINNIITNSLKYRRPEVKGLIELTISEYEHTVIFEIKDNGMGVDRESLPRIFDTLYRADKARSNVRDGSGLGLSVCKQIVELHGGLIWAQSEVGNGLSIFISLPIYSADK